MHGQLAIYGETARQKQAHINLPYLEEMFQFVGLI